MFSDDRFGCSDPYWITSSQHSVNIIRVRMTKLLLENSRLKYVYHYVFDLNVPKHLLIQSLGVYILRPKFREAGRWVLNAVQIWGEVPFVDTRTGLCF